VRSNAAARLRSVAMLNSASTRTAAIRGSRKLIQQPGSSAPKLLDPLEIVRSCAGAAGVADLLVLRHDVKHRTRKLATRVLEVNLESQGVAPHFVLDHPWQVSAGQVREIAHEIGLQAIWSATPPTSVESSHRAERLRWGAGKGVRLPSPCAPHATAFRPSRGR
jgi:hypothetical protein